MHSLHFLSICRVLKTTASPSATYFNAIFHFSFHALLSISSDTTTTNRYRNRSYRFLTTLNPQQQQQQQQRLRSASVASNFSEFDLSFLNYSSSTTLNYCGTTTLCISHLQTCTQSCAFRFDTRRNEGRISSSAIVLL